ncbi:unnamed protein product [Mytilus coruscus]|uniref:B box-type domain-containing protein n=1 Tax=Mytilus coruscus TaxID=42192 RepID=A0A6J8D340_MYTCO|nr:unnamed protein product [Mytilus coruscus]
MQDNAHDVPVITKELNHHVIIKLLILSKLKTIHSSFKTECDKHRKQLNLYCPSHLMPCCDKCISSSHSKCTGIKHLASVDDKVYLFPADGKLQKQLPIPGGAFSVTGINGDNIAITYPSETAIKIFNMENETVTQVIKLDKCCYGLSFSNKSLAVGLSEDEIRIIDFEGNTLKSTLVQSRSQLEYLVYCNKRIIYSDWQCKLMDQVNKSGINTGFIRTNGTLYRY